jgi:hypothetical protein
MLELLGYLRANNFKPFIVSGGGVEFMRCFAEESLSLGKLGGSGLSSQLPFYWFG